MSLTLNTIFNFSETPFKLKLIAGKQGLLNTVSWIYYTEDPETIEFIRGNELAITTGLNIERLRQNNEMNSDLDTCVSSFLKEFIVTFINHNASGLIVNTGKYIHTIPQEIIDFCNDNNFPLFTMPWEIHTIDVMQDIGNMISASNQKANNLERFFYKAIFDSENFDSKQLENTDFYDAKAFSIALIQLPEDFIKNDMEQAKRYINYSFNSKLNVSQNDYCCFLHKHKIIYIIRNDNAMFFKELTRIAKIDRFLKNMKISISDYCNSIEEIGEIYNHALVTMNISKEEGAVSRYSDMGLFKLLVDVKNQKTLQALHSEVFEKLNILEEDKREDYIKTLKLYLKFGGNIQLAADHNNIHRNTAIYRIKRLEEIMNLNLEDGDTRCLVQTALYIRELLGQ